MRTNVYIDGFNLYFGSLKDTPHKWLNLWKFCVRMLPNNEIQTVKYFSAMVSERGTDPGQVVRQDVYIRALRTLPNVEIIMGSFLTTERMRPLASPPATGSRFVKILNTEEKGSDANLAAHLVADGYENKYDVAVLVTNDSDQVGPITLVRTRLRKEVGFVNPHPTASSALRRATSFVKHVRNHPGLLADCQLSAEVVDARGRLIRKPSEW
ncbi:MAG TPA: NYN domain-containing protein [Thermoanaerobaculia bacterium]|nr:NYN domain-containing protein [Thermoanaerobaculia bacterium]